MATTPEGKVKLAVKKRLNANRVWWFAPMQNGMGRVGIPDFICCQPVRITADMVGKEIGVFLAIETKAPGKLNTLTANQEKVISEILEHAGQAHVVDAAEQIDEVLCGRHC